MVQYLNADVHIYADHNFILEYIEPTHVHIEDHCVSVRKICALILVQCIVVAQYCLKWTICYLLVNNRDQKTATTRSIQRTAKTFVNSTSLIL